MFFTIIQTMASQEENPLQTQNKTFVPNFKNNVGRPKRKSEIIFSPPPKSIISSILCEEQKQIQENSICEQDLCSNLLSAESFEEKRTCEDCSDGIIYNQNDYNDHILLHKNKIYQCNHENCSYVTKFSSNLTTHKRTHTSERPYACDECTFRTNFINSLKSHKRLHRAELPFACQYCKYKCNSGSNLKKHCMRKHSDILKNK